MDGFEMFSDLRSFGIVPDSNDPGTFRLVEPIIVGEKADAKEMFVKYGHLPEWKPVFQGNNTWEYDAVRASFLKISEACNKVWLNVFRILVHEDTERTDGILGALKSNPRFVDFSKPFLDGSEDSRKADDTFNIVASARLRVKYVFRNANGDAFPFQQVYDLWLNARVGTGVEWIGDAEDRTYRLKETGEFSYWAVLMGDRSELREAYAAAYGETFPAVEDYY